MGARAPQSATKYFDQISIFVIATFLKLFHINFLSIEILEVLVMTHRPILFGKFLIIPITTSGRQAEAHVFIIIQKQ